MGTSTALARRVASSTVLFAAAGLSQHGPETAQARKVSPVYVAPDTSDTSPGEDSANVEDSDLRRLTAPELLRTFERPNASLALLATVLEELLLRREPKAASLIAGRLCRRDLAPAWRAALVQLAESVHATDPALRTTLAAGLKTSALLLRDRNDASADAPLWAAVRGLSGLVTAAQSEVFLLFLRPEDKLTTQQVALQALQGIAANAPEGEVPADVRSRLAEFTAGVLRADWLVSSERIALAANAYAAAQLAGVESRGVLSQRMRDLRLPLLERQAALVERRARGEVG